MRDGIHSSFTLCLPLRLSHSNGYKIQEGDIQRVNFCLFRNEIGGNYRTPSVDSVQDGES